jgi:hypothetical protein
MFKKVAYDTHPPQARQDALFPGKAAGRKNPEAYPLGYVENFF